LTLQKGLFCGGFAESRGAFSCILLQRYGVPLEAGLLFKVAGKRGFLTQRRRDATKKAANVASLRRCVKGFCNKSELYVFSIRMASRA
jgi:hypothetical protein